MCYRPIHLPSNGARIQLANGVTCSLSGSQSECSQGPCSRRESRTSAAYRSATTVAPAFSMVTGKNFPDVVTVNNFASIIGDFDSESLASDVDHVKGVDINLFDSRTFDEEFLHEG